jgi:hypothetical protein
MITRLPKIDKLILPGTSFADLSDVVSAITVDYGTDQVAELNVVIVDPGHKVTKSPIADVGSVIIFDGDRWQVGSIEAALTEWGSQVTIRCRDPLAKKLRATYRTSAEKKVAPSTWVSQRVRTAGGRALIQQSSSRGTISQSKSQSVLDVIGDLASELDWSWTSHGDHFFFASRHYAWSGQLGQSAWTVTWKTDPASDALNATWTDSDDNTVNRREMELEVTYDAGYRMRPWQRINSTIPGASGYWLIESVSITHDGTTPVTVNATRPKPPSPKAGSSSRES